MIIEDADLQKLYNHIKDDYEHSMYAFNLKLGMDPDDEFEQNFDVLESAIDYGLPYTEAVTAVNALRDLNVIPEEWDKTKVNHPIAWVVRSKRHF